MNKSDKLIQILAVVAVSVGLKSEKGGGIRDRVRKSIRNFVLALIKPKDFFGLMYRRKFVSNIHRCFWVYVYEGAVQHEWPTYRQVGKKEVKLNSSLCLLAEEKVMFNLPLLANSNVERICFVFYMGLGDYLYTTSFIRAVRDEFPSLTIVAYVSASLDANNNPLVKKLLGNNPDVDEVCFFEGQLNGVNWRNYNFDSIFLVESAKGGVVVPLLYNFEFGSKFRPLEVFDLFKMPLSGGADNVHIHCVLDEETEVFAQSIIDQAQAQGCERIVFLQLDARSSGYSYPYVDELVGLITLGGGFVVSASSFEYPKERALLLDFKLFSIDQTFALLIYIKNSGFPIQILSINSVFWAASTGMGIRNLGLQYHFEPVSAFWADNITIIAHVSYNEVPKNNLIVCPRKYFEINAFGKVTYLPDFVVKCLFEIKI